MYTNPSSLAAPLQNPLNHPQLKSHKISLSFSSSWARLHDVTFHYSFSSCCIMCSSFSFNLFHHFSSKALFQSMPSMSPMNRKTSTSPTFGRQLLWPCHGATKGSQTFFPLPRIERSIKWTPSKLRKTLPQQKLM